MTNPLDQYKELEQEQARIAQKLKELEQKKVFQQAVAFKQDIDDVLEKHGKTEADLLAFFDPSSSKRADKTQRRKTGKPLPLKLYTNSETDEKVTAKSLKNPILQTWVKKYGRDTVKGWGVEISDEEATKDSPE